MRLLALPLVLAAALMAAAQTGVPPSPTPPPQRQTLPPRPGIPHLLPPPTPPPRPLTLTERVDILMARKRYYAAIDLLQTGLKARPKDASLLNRIGVSYQMLGDNGRAEDYYKKAIHADKHFADAYNNLGTVYYENRDYDKALKYYKKAIHYQKGKATYFLNAGTAEFMRKKLKNARRDYVQALRLDPTVLDPTGHGGSMVQDRSVRDKAQYHFFLSRLYCLMGNYDDAMRQLRQAMEFQYKDIERIFKDAAFKPLYARPDFQKLISTRPDLEKLLAPLLPKSAVTDAATAMTRPEK